MLENIGEGTRKGGLVGYPTIPRFEWYYQFATVTWLLSRDGGRRGLKRSALASAINYVNYLDLDSTKKGI